MSSSLSSPGFPRKEETVSNNDDAERLAENVQRMTVQGNDIDKPDISVKSTGLRESAETVKTETGGALYTSAKRFEDLGLSEPLLQGLYTEMNFERPSAIQATTLPMILTPPFKDLVAQAHNGSGKTTCFVLTMLSRVTTSFQELQAICVCPTRELVMQNFSVAKKMAKYTDITFFSTTEDLGRIQRCRSQVLFATHGRLKNWVRLRQVSFEHLKVLVFDEADNMLDLAGFADDSFRLVRDARRVSPDVQVLLFSATFNDRIRAFSLKLTKEPNHVFLPVEQLSLDVIKQYRVVVPEMSMKYHVLAEMIFPNCEKLKQTIIFVRSRSWAATLHRRLTNEGHACTAISGEMDFADRDRVIQEFRDCVTRILISTDILSRGFDVSEVALVVNYDVPVEHGTFEPAYETYLHRIGRSGRFGRAGCAFNFVCGEQENEIVDKISKFYKREIPEVPFNDEEKFVEVLKAAGLTEGNDDTLLL